MQLPFPALDIWLGNLIIKISRGEKPHTGFRPLHEPEKGCIVVIGDGQGLLTHIGIVLQGAEDFAHFTKRGPCIEPLGDYGDNIEGFYEYDG